MEEIKRIIKESILYTHDADMGQDAHAPEDKKQLLELHAHYLAEALEQHIIRMRIEEVKRRLADTESEKYSLLAIAFDSGFNSKSAFNTIFKKHTNTTPSQYRKQLK